MKLIIGPPSLYGLLRTKSAMFNVLAALLDAESITIHTIAARRVELKSNRVNIN